MSTEVPQRRSRSPFVGLLLALAALVIALGFGLPALHDQYGPGGRLPQTRLRGWLLGGPGAPQLLVPSESRRYLLAGPGKTAPSAEVMAHRGQWVQLEGSLFGRGDLAVMNTRRALPMPPPPGLPPLSPAPESLGQPLGQVDLVGEIVDGKCFSGVMKPGAGKTHRVCAIRCISGGVPAVFHAIAGDGTPTDFLLVDGEGQAVNDRVAELVADRIQIRGRLFQLDNLLVLQANPDDYRRV